MQRVCFFYYIRFLKEKKKAEYSDGVPLEVMVTMSKRSAYVNAAIFLNWLQNHFAPQKPHEKVLLILDRHTAHTSFDVLGCISTRNDIILLCLPRHTTHFLQPLERTFLKSLKAIFTRSAIRLLEIIL